MRAALVLIENDTSTSPRRVEQYSSTARIAGQASSGSPPPKLSSVAASAAEGRKAIRTGASRTPSRGVITRGLAPRDDQARFLKCMQYRHAKLQVSAMTKEKL